MLATKSSVLIMVILISVCWIAVVDSFCGGCSCNIAGCNCDCVYNYYCKQTKDMCSVAAPYMLGRRSITDDETDPSIIFAKLDKNEVKHFIGKIIVGKVLPFLKFFLFSNCYSKKQDGVLSLEEISLDIEEINLKGLLAMDLDKDGVISANEFDRDLSE